MKHLRRFCAVMLLTLSLSFSAFAGDILIPGATTQPTPKSSSISATSATPTGEDSSTGDILIPGAHALDPVTEFTLSLLQNLLSLF